MSKRVSKCKTCRNEFAYDGPTNGRTRQYCDQHSRLRPAGKLIKKSALTGATGLGGLAGLGAGAAARLTPQKVRSLTAEQVGVSTRRISRGPIPVPVPGPGQLAISVQAIAGPVTVKLPATTVVRDDGTRTVHALAV